MEIVVVRYKMAKPYASFGLCSYYVVEIEHMLVKVDAQENLVYLYCFGCSVKMFNLL